jgi:methyl-accepting chemotaxis protein
MDKVTQSAAANAEESAAAAEELSGQATQMASIVNDLAQLVGGRKAAGDETRPGRSATRASAPRLTTGHASQPSEDFTEFSKAA